MMVSERGDLDRDCGGERGNIREGVNFNQRMKFLGTLSLYKSFTVDPKMEKRSPNTGKVRTGK